MVVPVSMDFLSRSQLIRVYWNLRYAYRALTDPQLSFPEKLRACVFLLNSYTGHGLRRDWRHVLLSRSGYLLLDSRLEVGEIKGRRKAAEVAFLSVGRFAIRGGRLFRRMTMREWEPHVEHAIELSVIPLRRCLKALADMLHITPE